MVRGLSIPWLGINFTGVHYGMSKAILGNLINITYVENPGIAFGFDFGPKMLFTIIRILALIIILYYIIKHRKSEKFTRIGLAFILAGDAGNLIDRTFYGVWFNYAPLFYGRVVDFIRIDLWSFTLFGKTYNSWPIFNIADVSVTIGFLFLIVFYKKIFKHKDEKILSSSEVDNSTDEKISGNKENEQLNSPGDSIIENSETNKDTGSAGTV